MRSRLKLILLAIGALALVLVVGFWRYRARTTSHPNHTIIVRDRSQSVPSGCDCSGTLLAHAFADPHVGPGSTVTLTVTGDQSTAREPRVVASILVPYTRQVFEGREGAERRKQQLITDLKSLCEKIPPATQSPIFLAIKRAVEQLRALGCEPSGNCTVYVQSDLEENGDAQIKAALNHSGKTQPPLPSPIDNDGINIVLVGVAETSGTITTARAQALQLTKPHDSGRADRIKAVWIRLFTDPSRLTFEPYCTSVPSDTQQLPQR
jgi:hypothetical protein